MEQPEQAEQPQTQTGDATDTEGAERALTPEEVGELRERLRQDGWRSDVGWVSVGVGASAQVSQEGQEPVRRTIAYLPSLRAVDGGAARLWKDGDVPAPRQADVREVMVADPQASDWHSETFEAPVTTVVHDTDAAED